MPKRRVLFVFPTAWDRKQLEACRSAWEASHEIVFAEPSDLDCPSELDPLEYVDRTCERYRGRIEGVTSSSDYPGASIAAAVAQRLGLPGADPVAVVRSSHKYYSRLAQREVAPEATPPFALIDPRKPGGGAPPDLAYPCFIKPVKGAFSVMARKLQSEDDLEAFLARPAVREFATDFVAIFNRIVAELTPFEVDGSHFLAEGFLHGLQVTVEGYEHEGEIEILGVVDSIMHPGTGSFARFDTPSVRRAEIQERMADITRRVARALGLRQTLFNLELIYEPADDSIQIIEMNPRLCGQFADLHAKVDGTSSYEVALALACGERPRRRRREGRWSCATSFALRVFEPVRVLAAPDATRIAEVEARHPGALVWWECTAGDELSDFERLEDGNSFRYGVVNLGADSRTGLLAKLGEVQEGLGYRFEAISEGR